MTAAPVHYAEVTSVSIRLDKRLGQGLYSPQAQCLCACLTDGSLEDTPASSLQVRQFQESFQFVCTLLSPHIPLKYMQRRSYFK